MTILLDQPELTLDQPVMVDKPECTLVLEFTSMRGETMRPIVRHMSVRIPNDRASLPDQPTLRDVVLLAIKRLHPVMQYVAEQNGVRVQSYFERYTFQQIMSCIEYDSNGAAIRITP